MKKLIPLAIALAFIFTTFTSVYADAMTPKSIDTNMSEIRLEQGVKSNDKINTNYYNILFFKNIQPVFIGSHLKINVTRSYQ